MTPEVRAALDALVKRPITDAEATAFDTFWDSTPGAEVRNDVEITKAINGLRAPVRGTRLIGEGTVSAALGYPAGTIFIRALRLMAEAPMPESPTDAEFALKCGVEEAWRHLQRGDLDVNLESVRLGIDAMTGALPLTAEQAAVIKDLDLRPDLVGMSEVSRALCIAEGMML